MADRALQIVRDTVAAIGAGPQVLVAAQAGYRLVVVALALSASGATQITLQDQTTSLFDAYLAANSPLVMPECTAGWIKTAENQSFTIVLQNAVTVQGVIVYRMIPTHQEY